MYGVLTISDINRVVAVKLGVSVLDIVGRSQRLGHVRARMIAMHLSRRIIGLSYPSLGKRYRRDHTTAMHADRKIARLSSNDPAVARLLDDLTEECLEIGSPVTPAFRILAQHEAHTTIEPSVCGPATPSIVRP